MINTDLSQLIKKKKRNWVKIHENKSIYKDSIVSCEVCEGDGAFFPNQYSLGDPCDFCNGTGKMRQIIYKIIEVPENNLMKKIYKLIRKFKKDFRSKYDIKIYNWE